MNTKELSIPGFKIACKLWGNPVNPPILAIHGWLDNANSFDGLAPLLAKQFYVIAIDLPGHGHSSHLPEGCYYHFTDAIFTVIEIITALKLDKVHLLGHSMGACLASLLAGIVPDIIESMTLIEGLGPFSAPEHTACEQLTKYASYLEHKKASASRGYSTLDAAARVRAAKGYVSLEIATQLSERALKVADGRYHWRHDRRLTIPSPLRLTEEQVLSCLRAIRCKSLLISAHNGFSFDTQLMKARLEAVKGIQTVELEGGHHIHMEQPEAVAALIQNFGAGTA